MVVAPGLLGLLRTPDQVGLIGQGGREEKKRKGRQLR